jgi:hypothetical protein
MDPVPTVQAPQRPVRAGPAPSVASNIVLPLGRAPSFDRQVHVNELEPPGYSRNLDAAGRLGQTGVLAGLHGRTFGKQ